MTPFFSAYTFGARVLVPVIEFGAVCEPAKQLAEKINATYTHQNFSLQSQNTLGKINSREITSTGRECGRKRERRRKVFALSFVASLLQLSNKLSWAHMSRHTLTNTQRKQTIGRMIGKWYI